MLLEIIFEECDYQEINTSMVLDIYWGDASEIIIIGLIL